MAGVSANIEASCAICGAAPSVPECPHEGQRLELALDQAVQRWAGIQQIRDWVLVHARNDIIATFHQLKQARRQYHLQYLESLPCYTLYRKWPGNPPMPPSQLQVLRVQIHNADVALQAGVDEDWRTCCLRYPQVLDYYFGLVDISLPSESDPAVRDPRFGLPQKEIKKVKARRDSVGSATRDHRKKERRRSRTPAPVAYAPGTRR